MQASDLPSLLAQMLRDEVRAAVSEVLAERLPAQSERPALLTPDQLAQQLQISRSKLDSMLADDPTFPFVRVGAVKRFEFEKVLDHLRSQRAQEAA